MSDDWPHGTRTLWTRPRVLLAALGASLAIWAALIAAIVKAS